jgi:hypothetical protein
MSSTIDSSLRLNLKGPIAHSLNTSQRQEIAIQAIGERARISHVAKRYSVSRKFVYQQKEKALRGIVQAFEEQPPEEDKVLFHLPVTKKWVSQFTLALLLIARCPYQGVVEIFRDLFDYNIAKGSVHNIAYRALEQAKTINRQQNLAGVTVGVHDEIYQAGNPVLAGICAHSTFCYLLSREESCDANAWGVHLLWLKEKQNLNPDKTIADGGPAARKGQKEAWPDTPCSGDVFHALHPFGKLCQYQYNRVVDALKAVEDFNHKVNCPRGKWKEDENRQEALKKLVGAETTFRKAKALSDDLDTLHHWLKNDILSLTGPSYEERYTLLEFVIAELRSQENICKHRIEPVRKYLENHKDNLLEFVPEMEKLFAEVAAEFEVSLTDVRGIANLRGLSTQKYWEARTILYSRLKTKFNLIEPLVDEILDSIIRASSLVENLNSRLRNYFTLRRHLGNEYLEILRFFLNHRRFMRSECPERVGKSPAELLTGESHGHWLEMLGFELFKQAA